MKRFISNTASVGKKLALSLAACAMTCAAFAEGEASSGVTAQLVTPYITDGKTQILAVLTAGAVIIGGFFVWRLIKKALNASK